MRKIFLIIITIVVTLIVTQGINLYMKINEPLRESQEEVLKYITNNTDVQNIENLDFYHGLESFHVAFGENNEGKEVIIWVPKTLDEIIIKKQSEGLSREEVLNFVETKLSPKKIISITLGMENSVALYEIIYRDQQDRYSYYYISFKDGTYLKHYRL